MNNSGSECGTWVAWELNMEEMCYWHQLLTGTDDAAAPLQVGKQHNSITAGLHKSDIKNNALME